MTLIRQIYGVLGLPIWTSIGIGFLRNALCTWSKFTVAMGILCRGSLLAVLWGSTSSSFRVAWWMTLSITSSTLFLPRRSYGRRSQSRSWSLLDHLREITRSFFIRRIQPIVNAINTHFESLKKEVADLEARHERLLSSITSLSHFEDQTLISGLWLLSRLLLWCSFIVVVVVFFFLVFISFLLSLCETFYFFSTYDLFDKSNRTYTF